MDKEIEKEPYQQSPEELAQEQPKDFKVAEIWIRDGQIHLDASGEFWGDKCRALGILEFCKEIVKTAKQPREEKPDLVVASSRSPFDFWRNMVNRKRK